MVKLKSVSLKVTVIIRELSNLAGINEGSGKKFWWEEILADFGSFLFNLPKFLPTKIIAFKVLHKLNSLFTMLT